jgi:hypothetical protein
MACLGAVALFVSGLSVVANSLLISLEHGLPLALLEISRRRQLSFSEVTSSALTARERI